jgi:hypothetical protein
VQIDLRVVTVHSNTCLDVLVAKHLVGPGPLLGTAALGWFVAATARALTLPKWRSAASAASCAVLASISQVATGGPGRAAVTELSTSTGGGPLS